MCLCRRFDFSFLSSRWKSTEQDLCVRSEFKDVAELGAHRDAKLVSVVNDLTLSAVIDKSTVVVVHEDRFAPVGYLKIEELHVEEKDTQLAESLRKCVPVCTPPKRRSEQADYRLGDAEKEEMEEKQRVKVHREAYAVDLRSSSAFSAQ